MVVSIICLFTSLLYLYMAKILILVQPMRFIDLDHDYWNSVCQVRTGQDRTGQNRTELDRTGQNRTELGRIGQNKTE